MIHAVPFLSFLLTVTESSGVSGEHTSLGMLGQVFTQIINWVISFLGLISSEPLLLVGLAIMVVGLVAGLAYRIVRGKGRGRA